LTNSGEPENSSPLPNPPMGPFGGIPQVGCGVAAGSGSKAAGGFVDVDLAAGELAQYLFA